ncbi:MAG: DUF4349 domain-containing protein [Dehalococcoidia bacterium]
MARSRAGGAQTSVRQASVAGMAAIAIVAALALAGCSARNASDLKTGVANGSGGVAVAPSEGAAKPGAPSSIDRAASSPNQSPEQPLPTVGDARTIIRNGTADLEVRSVADAFESIRQIAAAANGSVADSSFTGSGDRQSAQMTLRVPVERFGDVVARLREIAVEVRSITTTSNDVTDEYTDVEATLRNLRAVEAQYVQLLGRAGTIGDVLQVQDRLNQVRLQIDRTEARRQSLASRAAMSTITVSLRPASGIVSGSGPLARAGAAWQASLRTLEVIGTVLLVVIVYSWWLVPPIAIGAFFGWRAYRRRHPAAPPTTAPA